MNCLVVVVLAAATGVASAPTFSGAQTSTRFDTPELSITIPNGFQRMSQVGSQSNAEVTIFMRAHDPPLRGATMLEILTYDLDVPIDSVSAEDRERLAAHYNAQILDRLGQGSSVSSVSALAKVDKIPTSKTTWEGTIKSVRMHGVVFSAFVGQKVVILQALDQVDATDTGFENALESISHLKFRLP